ncbi:hypothetical protein AAZX31_13G327900 [Glycine max]
MSTPTKTTQKETCGFRIKFSGSGSRSCLWWLLQQQQNSLFLLVVLVLVSQYI